MSLSIGLGQNRVRRRGRAVFIRVFNTLKLSQSPKMVRIYRIWTGNHLLLTQNAIKSSKAETKLPLRQSGMVERRRQAGKSHVWHTLTRFF